MGPARQRKHYHLKSAISVFPSISQASPRQPSVLIFACFVIPLLFIVRIIKLQLINGSRHAFLAEGNHISLEKIEAPRGIIFDRHGHALVHNNPIFLQNKENKQVIISRQQALSPKFSNKNIIEKIIRSYPEKESFAHILGYTAPISTQEYEKKKTSPQSKQALLNTRLSFASRLEYEFDDSIGKVGIEKEYESLLKGARGAKIISIDPALGTREILGYQQPVAGNSILLTVDKTLQTFIYNSLKKYHGAAIALDPSSGEVLALVSTPSYDPNLFSNRYQKAEDLPALLASDDMPLVNRALTSVYPPGSLFKIVTAIAGLESGAIDEKTLIEDVGEIRLGAWKFGNWYYYQYGKTEGKISITKAIARSNDIFFYKLGEMVGPQAIFKWAEKLSYNQITGIDLPAESSGIIPNPEWKQKTKNERWFLGNTYHMSVGQGDVLTTPLQNAVAMAAVANNGILCRPHLLKQIKPSKGLENAMGKQDFSTYLYFPCHSLGLQPKTLKIVRQGMLAACQKGGTGWPFFDFSIPVGCKTGTAQHGGEKDLPHAWFSVFAPFDDPKIVVTVLAESSGEGSYVAAPIARKILEFWFNNNK